MVNGDDHAPAMLSWRLEQLYFLSFLGKVIPIVPVLANIHTEVFAVMGTCQL